MSKCARCLKLLRRRSHQATSTDPSAPLRFSVAAYFGSLAAVMAAAAAALVFIERQAHRQIAATTTSLAVRSDDANPTTNPLLRPDAPALPSPLPPPTRGDANGRALEQLLGSSSLVAGLWCVRSPAGRLFAAQVQSAGAGLHVRLHSCAPQRVCLVRPFGVTHLCPPLCVAVFRPGCRSLRTACT